MASLEVDSNDNRDDRGCRCVDIIGSEGRERVVCTEGVVRLGSRYGTTNE